MIGQTISHYRIVGKIGGGGMGVTGRKFGGRKKGVPNKSTSEIRALAQEYSPEAIRRLVSLMRQSDDRKLQFAAARELLYRGYCPPKELGDSSQELGFNLSVRFRDSADGPPPQVTAQMAVDRLLEIKTTKLGFPPPPGLSVSQSTSTQSDLV